MSKKMLIKIGTALAIIAVVLAPLILGGIPMQVLVAVVVFAASYEIAGLKDESKPRWALSVFIAAGTMILGIAPDSELPMYISIWLMLLFLLALFDEPFDCDQGTYTFTLSMIIVFAVHAVKRIYVSSFGWEGMIFVALATFICDTAAYFCGSFFGRHKMIPRVSPNKTWEGAIGGYIFGAAISIAFGLLVSKTLPSDLVIVAGLILPATAEVGDLAFSLVKRRWGMKDFGSLFPGHGGVLDRVDSLLFCLMVFNALMIWKGIGV